MNQKVKGAVIFASGLIGGTIIGSGLVVKQILGDDDFLHAISNKICNKIDKILFGEENVTRHKYTSYRKGNDKHDFKLQEVVFVGRSSAEDVFNNMDQCISQYGFVSALDYYDLSGITGKYTDAKFGWKTLVDVEIKHTERGYIIDLPQPIPIE